MHKILHLDQDHEIVFSLPKSSVMANENIIRMFSKVVGVSINDTDIQNAVAFSAKPILDMEAVVFILNQDGLSFLPDKIFMHEEPNAPIVEV